MTPRTRRDPQGFETKRRSILAAAARVFARRGYSGTRVRDIAEEADIAYGLVYHYFGSKEDVLRTLFEEYWSLTLKVVEQIDAGDGDLRQKLLGVAGFFLEAWRQNPDIVEVVLVEVVRGPKLLEGPNLTRVMRILDLLESLFARHQASGEMRADADPRLTALLFMGALETLMTGVLAKGAYSPDLLVEQGRAALVDTFLGGVLAR